MRSFLVLCSFSIATTAALGCSGRDGAGLVGDDQPGADPGASGAAQELVEKPGAKDERSASGAKPQDSSTAPTPPAVDGGSPPPPPPPPPPPAQTYYRLSIGGASRDPIAPPEAKKGLFYGELDVHALLAKAQGLAPEETLDVQFPKDKIGSFACDADHRVVWVKPEANKIAPKVYATRSEVGCRVDITRIDSVGGWVEGSAQGTLVYSPIVGPVEQKSVSVVFRVQRTQ